MPQALTATHHLHPYRPSLVCIGGTKARQNFETPATAKVSRTHRQAIPKTWVEAALIPPPRAPPDPGIAFGERCVQGARHLPYIDDPSALSPPPPSAPASQNQRRRRSTARLVAQGDLGPLLHLFCTTVVFVPFFAPRVRVAPQATRCAFGTRGSAKKADNKLSTLRALQKHTRNNNKEKEQAGRKRGPTNGHVLRFCEKD